MFFPAYRRFLSILIVAVGISSCTTVSGPSIPGISLSASPLIGKFVWHDLITDDTDAARRFYAGMFDWTFEETSRPGGGDYILAKSADRYVGGFVHQDDPDDGDDFSRWLGYLSVADVDRAVAATRSAGGKILVDTRELGEIGNVAAIQDPQGAVIGLIRIQHGDPDDTAAKSAGQIIWNELLASDSAEAADFYRQLAGYDVQTLQRRGGEYIKLKAGNTERAGIMQNPFDDSPPEWLTYFAVADLSAMSNKVESLGGKVLIKPSADFREGTLALIADPGGAVLVLQKWPDQSGG